LWFKLWFPLAINYIQRTIPELGSCGEAALTCHPFERI